MKNISFTRLIYMFLCFVSAISFPYPITFFLIILGLVLFDTFIEGILCILISDIVFSMPIDRFHSIYTVGTLIIFTFFVLISYGKQKTRFHEYF